MPIDDYYRSYSFRLFNWDVLLSTITVFVLLFIAPFLFSGSSLKPFKEALSDFEITDIYFSVILPELELPKETDVLIVNTYVQTKYGLKELSDANYAQMIKAIQQFQPEVIGINHDFTIKRSDKSYNYVYTVLHSFDNLVLEKELEIQDGEFVLRHEEGELYDGLNITHSNFLKDRDRTTSTIRSFPAKIIDGIDTSVHFGIELAKVYNEDAVNRMFEKNQSFETINYLGDHSKYDIINAQQLFRGEFDPELIKNKIVIMGPIDTLGLSHDFSKIYYTPLNENSSGRTIPDMYETLIHSNIVSMVIFDEYFKKVPEWGATLIAFVICYLNMLLFGYVGWKSKKWYELIALVVFMVESFGIAIVNVLIVNEFKMQINLTSSVIAAALSIPIFELYTDSVKPFVEFLIQKIFGTKKNKGFSLE